MRIIIASILAVVLCSIGVFSPMEWSLWHSILVGAGIGLGGAVADAD